MFLMNNDKLIMENYLLLLKSTMEVYVHGSLEASNSKVRKTLKHGLDETLMSQSLTYDEMVNNGWYCVNNVKSNLVKEVIKKVKSNC